MKHLKLFFLLITLAFTQNNFGQTANVNEGCFPLTVQFTAPGGTSTYFWDFKDGVTSVLQNPSNTFTSAGSYIVEFRETPSSPITGTVTITIYDKPIPEFSTDVSRGCAPLAVNFIDTTVMGNGVTVSGYSWVFGDGAVGTGSAISHTFVNEGNYFVSLEIFTNFPSCDITKKYDNLISLTNPPSTSFTINPPPPYCSVPETITFTNTSSGSGAPLTYNWDFGNGNTSTLENPPAEIYTLEGNYLVTLTATDTNGCAITEPLNINLGQPVASFQVDSVVCLGGLDTMINLSPAGTYLWDFGPNATPTSSTQTNPTVTFNTSGFQDIKLTIQGACPDDTIIRIYVEDIDPTFVSSPSYSCSEPMLVNFTPTVTNAASYQWVFGDGDTSSLQNPSVTYTTEDTTIYSINGAIYFLTSLTITSAGGCSATSTSIDTLHLPNALIMPDVVDGCLPLTVDFTDESTSNEDIVSWEWIFGDGTTITAANNNNQTHTYTVMGEYEAYLIITNSAGCKDTSYIIPIKVGDVMSPDFTVDLTSVCPGDSVQFTDLTPAPLGDSIDVWNYSTESDRMFNCFQDAAPMWSFNDETGPQDVTLTVGFNGCFSSVTKPALIDVKGPIAKINYFSSCEQPFEILFTDSSLSTTSVIWDFGDGNTATISDSLYTYATTGDYQVTLEAINSGSGCPNSYDTATVYIRDIQANFNSDSLLCQSVAFPFDAALSQDVNESCNSGYMWSFSNPGTRPITTANASENISFPATGQNEVTLVVTDINGCKDTAASFVEVYNITVGFDFDKDTICAPSLVTFNDTSLSDTTIVSWLWNFGNGDTSIIEDPTYTYQNFAANVTSINVSLTVTNELGCIDSTRLPIYVYHPTSSIGVSDNTLCAGDVVNFTATDFTSQGSNLIFNWDFDNGDSSIVQNPTETFDSSGAFTVSMVYEEISTGCKDSTTTVLNVQDYPIAGFISPDDTSLVLCPNNNVLFTDTSITSSPITSYAWDFGDGSTSTVNPTGIAYTTNGTYTVQLIVSTSYGCRDTTERDFVVRGPSGSFYTDLQGKTICRLDEVEFTIFDTTVVDTFYWDFGDGIILGGVSPIKHQYSFVPPSGQTIAKLIMANADGTCPLTKDTIINIYQVIADFDRNFNDVDTAVCFQDYPLTNTSQNADVWYWDFGDGHTSTTGQPLTHNYDAPGTYQVTLGIQSSTLTCTDTLTKIIIIDSLPIVSVLNDTICEGQIDTLNAINPNVWYRYSWEPSTMVVTPNQPSTPTIPLTTTTVFTVTATDMTTTAKCSSSATATTFVINDIQLADFDTILVVGDQVVLPMWINGGLYDLVWTPEDGLSCLNCAYPVVRPLEDIIYNIVVTDKFNCGFSAEAIFDIKIHPETFIKLPTTFTPNGDGVNDVIYVEGWGIKEMIEFKIFNRWGEQIFETNDEEQGWDGFYKGVLQNNDIYVYKVKVITWREETKTLEGHINLMR